MSYKIERGFTLLELIVAIAIFTILSLSAYQVLQGVILQDEISQKKSDRLAEIQRALLIIERDFNTAIPLIPRDDSGLSSQMFSAQPNLLESDDWGVSFVRNSWQNPEARLPRSDQERLAYRLKNNQLERMNYNYPDPIPGTEPFRNEILTGVTAFKLRFFDNNNWQTTWQKSNNLPQGVEITLKLEDFGVIKRIFVLLPLTEPLTEEES